MPTFTAKTVDEAIENGLESLEINRQDATINVVQTDRRGFFGIGRRDAIVEIDPIAKNKTSEPTQEIAKQTNHKNEKNIVRHHHDDESHLSKNKVANRDAVEQLMGYLKPIIDELGIQAHMQPKLINRKFARINFTTEQEGLLIGKHGLTINALQNSSQIYLNHIGFSRLTIQLDTADYRHRRTEILKKLAEKTAREAVATGQPVYLDPMPSFERKVIHNQLENNLYVNTFSSGREPYRAVVVEPENG